MKLLQIILVLALFALLLGCAAAKKPEEGGGEAVKTPKPLAIQENDIGAVEDPVLPADLTAEDFETPQ